MLLIRISLLILLIPLLSLLGAKSVFAVTVTISNVSSTISDQSFSFNVSVSGAQAGTNYLRANLYPAGTTKYFGYTFNGTTFVNSSDYSQYLPISIDSSGNWSGTIEAKLDSNSSYFSGPGSYNLKVRRYTQSGSSYTWSNEVTLAVNLSSSTPSPTSTSNPSLIPSSTSSNSVTSSFTISNIPAQINSDQSFAVLISLSSPNNPNTNFYLKGTFKKADSSNYFGLTRVSGSWIKNGSTYSNQYPITTDPSGNWSGNLEVQPDSEDSGFTGSGDYIFKVGRYTSTGSGPIWSNESTIKITDFSKSQSESISDVTPTHTPSITSSKNISSKSIAAPSVKISSIAGISKSATPSPTPKSLVQPQKQINFLSIIGSILVIIGVIPITYAIYNKFRKRNEESS